MTKPPYNHPFLDYDELAAHLMGKGVVGDRKFIMAKLEEVGYQRLSAYWLPFTKAEGRIVASFGEIWSLYCFDRRLRALLLEALGRIEVTVRNRLIHFFAEEYGAFGYLKHENMPHTSMDDWLRWSRRQRDAAVTSKSRLVTDFFKRYSSERLPVWIACELMDFGSVVIMFAGVEQRIQKKTARSLGLNNPRILHSWLRSLNDVRNACAHHNRVWNRSWVKQPSLPLGDSCWNVRYCEDSASWQQTGDARQGSSHVRAGFDVTKTGIMLAVCKCLLERIDRNSDWGQRVRGLLASPPVSPQILSWMGFPAYWQHHPLWL